MNMPIIIDKKTMSTLPPALAATILELLRLAQRPAIKGEAGRGIRTVTVDPDTSAVTLTMTDGSAVTTPPLLGESVFDHWMAQNPGGTEAEFLEAMRATATPELLAARDQAVLAEQNASAANAGANLRIDDIERAVELADGGQDLMTVLGLGPVLRMLIDGLDFRPAARFRARLNIPPQFAMDAAAGDAALALGASDASSPDDAGGVIVETLNGRPVRKMYADGFDFLPSGRFRERLNIPDATDPYVNDWDQAGQNGVFAVDRFVTRGGVRFPVPMINGVSRLAIISSTFGQSNGDWQKVALPLFYSKPPFMHHAFMLNDLTSNAGRGGIIGWGGVEAPGASGLVQLDEGACGIQSFAGAALARLIAFDGAMRRVGVVRSSALGGAKLVGDTPTSGIWKGSTGEYTRPWLNWNRDLTDMIAATIAAGYEVQVINISFVHQEADWQTPRATYLSQFLAMKAEREAWIAANFPGIPVRWFVDQASGSARRNGSFLGGAWPDRMAIADAARPENGGDNITMVMPRYWMTMGNTSSGIDDIHHSPRGKVWQGEVYGHAMPEVEMGRAWRCPLMTSAAIAGNSVVVNFDSLLPLVIDMGFCKVRADAGFVIGNGAAVTGVRQTGQRQITVDCATVPGGSISYAYRSQDAQDVLDEWPISTGAIRDAWEAPSLFDPGKKLIRAALGYQLAL